GHIEGAIRDQCSPTRQLFDADTAGARLILRTRRDGDRFTPLGMQGSIKVGDYFTERGVIGPERERVPLVLNEETILWVVGYVPGESAAVRPNTRRILEITVEDAS
ncbi:MAG: tRNA lysidine(34) synthetase TilS, partial [Candidatus Hydrogenedentota bacterium]